MLKFVFFQINQFAYEQNYISKIHPRDESLNTKIWNWKLKICLMKNTLTYIW